MTSDKNEIRFYDFETVVITTTKKDNNLSDVEKKSMTDGKQKDAKSK